MSGDSDQRPPCDPRSWPEGTGLVQRAYNDNSTARDVVPSAAGQLSSPQQRSPAPGGAGPREEQNNAKTDEPHHPQVPPFEENLVDGDSYELPSTFSLLSSPIRGSPLNVGSPTTFSFSPRSNSHPSTASQPPLPTPVLTQTVSCTPATYVEGLTGQSLVVSPQFHSPGPIDCTSGSNDSPSLLREGSRYPRSPSPTHPTADAQDPEDLAEWYGSFVQDQPALLQQPPSSNIPAQIEHMQGRGCKCTRGHVYKSCPRFSEHFWAWFAVGAAKNDLCTCPPADEALLMLECPKLKQHITHGRNRNLPPLDLTEVTGQCSCPNARQYISARCRLYRQHLDHAWKGKARLYPENPWGCSCAGNPDLVSRSCQLCVNEMCRLEIQQMDKMYEPGRQRRDWSFESLIATASVMFGSSGATLEHSITTSDQSLLQNLDPGILKTPDEAVTTNPPDAPSPSIHEANHSLHQAMDFRSGHKSLNRMSKEPSDMENNPRRVVTHRIDKLSPRAGYDGGRVTPSIDARKRPAPEDSSSSRIYKKRKTEPPTNGTPVPSKESGPSRGGKKSNANPLSTMREEDYYYTKNTSLDDQTYFRNVIEKLRAAVYLQAQGHEPEISSEAGVALVGEPRAEGHGRAKAGEPVYAILVDKPPSGPFLCWICGHLEKQRKTLRVLGHVREHFEHRPWKCTQDHRAIRDGDGQPQGRRGRGKEGPCGQSFAYKEVLDDHQEKSNNFYQCRRRNCKTTFSTPSNRCKHEKKHETPS